MATHVFVDNVFTDITETSSYIVSLDLSDHNGILVIDKSIRMSQDIQVIKVTKNNFQLLTDKLLEQNFTNIMRNDDVVQSYTNFYNMMNTQAKTIHFNKLLI